MAESNVYFPPDSVNWHYFKKSGETMFSPVIGEGVFYNIVFNGEEKKNAAWSFPNPKEGFSHIKNYLTFGYGETRLVTERSG